VLGAIRGDSGEYRSYRVDRIQGATVTSQVFAPRYAVELTSTGPAYRCAFGRDVAHAKHRPFSENQTSRPNLGLSMHGLRKDIQQEKDGWLSQSSQESSGLSMLLEQEIPVDLSFETLGPTLPFPQPTGL